MTKLFLLDDDPSVTTILKLIIEEKALGKIVGISQSPLDALEDLPYLEPDIVVLDLLMPDMDGIGFVEEAIKKLPNTIFVMLSQVSAKAMVARAYDAGVRFFIQKPINAVEVTTVLENVIRQMTYERTIEQMQQVFSTSLPMQNGSAATSTNDTSSANETQERVRRILQKLGVIGEKGCEDIITVVSYFCKHENELSATTLKDICSRFSDQPKSMEQRIRRTAASGLSNIAHLGVDDFANETFSSYSGTLFKFDQVRKEMDFIQGRSDQHGNVQIKRFISALVNECRN